MPNIQTSNTTMGSMRSYSVYDSGLVIQDPPTAFPLMGYSIQRSYLKTTGYFSAIKRGKHPGMNAMTFIEDRHLYPAGSASYRWSSIRAYESGQLGYRSGRNPPSLESFSSKEKSDLDAKLRTEVRLAMKDQKINFGVAAAEWQKTADMVAETATAIAKCWGNLRRGNFAQAARDIGVTAPKRARRRFNRSYARNQQDAFASGWLELQYGWKPLLSDVYGAAEFAAKQVVPSVQSKIVQKSKISKDVTVPREYTYDGRKYLEVEQRRATFEYKYTVFFVISGRLASNASSAGLTNPLAVAWELVPYSFVVDWFLPIGDVLNSLDATAGLSFQMGCVGGFERSDVNTTRVNAGSNHSENTSWSRNYVRFDRYVLSDFPSVALPRFKNPVSVSHALSALALLNNFRK